MRVEELIARFPEIPEVLRNDPVLETYADVFDGLLGKAIPPSACQGSEQTAGNAIYMKLIAPMKILGYGLSTPEKTAAKLEGLMKEHEEDAQKFLNEMIPPDVSPTPGGCQES
jgi:hypothetical protein